LVVIGITGGIGSGKSTVSKMLFDCGVEIIDADSIAREVTDKGGEALEELASFFGEVILTNSGQLDRKKMAGFVFGNPDKLEALNRITHKYIIAKIIENINNANRDKKTDIVAIDAPIPVEFGFLDLVDIVWVIAADRNTRVKRIMERNELDYDSALKRIESQISDEAYLKIADEVIWNNGSREKLYEKVMQLFTALLKR
jgi:dephospho-CoA kinase